MQLHLTPGGLFFDSQKHFELPKGPFFNLKKKKLIQTLKDTLLLGKDH